MKTFMLLLVVLFSRAYCMTTSENACHNLIKAKDAWNKFCLELNAYEEDLRCFIDEEESYLKKTGRLKLYEQNQKEIKSALKNSLGLFQQLREEVSQAAGFTLEKPLYQQSLYAATYLEFTENFIKFMKSSLMIHEGILEQSSTPKSPS